MSKTSVSGTTPIVSYGSTSMPTGRLIANSGPQLRSIAWMVTRLGRKGGPAMTTSTKRSLVSPHRK